MYLYGASGHAKVIREILLAQGQPVDGFIDDNQELHELVGLPVEHSAEGKSPVIVSIGNNAIRQKVVRQLLCDFGTAVHPSAVVSPSATIGEGTVVMPGALINAEAKIGKHSIINTGVSIDHECAVGDFVHISPHATLCGNVHVGDGSWICAGSTVIQGVTIGRWCTIAAGSVVKRNIPDGAMVAGNPARVLKISAISE